MSNKLFRFGVLIEIDPEAWALEYAMKVEDVEGDAAVHLRNLLESTGNRLSEEGVIKSIRVTEK